ncbi:hypothetical protein ANOM_000828 [Aspergillus nomiae NRRL 13137]|uniref:Rhodopsin domain-containing protein n=1 Tax=Aspergillus nomiae NRRL (strain ATCC 15546 / NRRL 13137 / CBS 260.88 / M93) TaxID=1509407 RepID=A0A0L1JI24_ASPN3|nr:uncharacterized protein ANOM_000828 [Aspergillus nomiae NRRL 13137]KNG91033.1 hypothetical protein ANOM_000828 [Aspergillus nomiae NRRL 13137]
MPARSSPLLSRITPPLAADNHYDHSGLLVVITSLALFLALASFSIRAFAASKRSFMLSEDYVLLAVVICACVQVSVTLASVHYGWGKTRDMVLDKDFIPMLKTVYVADLFYVLVIGLSKVCSAVFYRNLSIRRSMRANNVILAACSVWTVLTMAVMGARCSKSPWKDIDNHCVGLLPRWKAVCALDIVLEAFILAYPVGIIYKVQISPLKKFVVFAILSFRIILIPLSAVHLYFIQKQVQSTDPTLTGTYATTVAQIHVGVSVLVLTVSSLKMFVAVYEDEQGLAYTEDASKALGISDNDNSRQSKVRSGRWSRQAQEPSTSSTGFDDGPAIPLASGARGGSNAIVKSVHISVTHEDCEHIALGKRGPHGHSGSVM